MRTITIAILFSILMVVPAYAIDVREKMTAREFQNSGIEKLTNEEITELNNWLDRYILKIATILKNRSSSNSGDVIESTIEGEFNGWDGETIFKLDNGQIWQQSSYSYSYKYSYRPKVFIFKVGSVYKMKVDGMSNAIYVKRLK
jgi:hypothetical protein